MSTRPAILLVSSRHDMMMAVLNEQGVDAEITCLATQDEFRSAVEAREFALVVCDCSMQSVDAITLLALLKARDLEVPVIMMVDEGKEGEGVEAMRHGAADYLIKGQWLRLGAVVERELRRAAKFKENLAERIDLDRCLTTTMEHITDPFFTVDREWRITFANTPALLSVHRDRDELLGKVLWDVFVNLKESNIGRKYRQAVSEKRSIHSVEYYPSLERWYEIVAYPSNGGLAVCFHDVTDRRHQEEQLVLLNQCVSLINDVVLITEADLLDEPGPRIVFVNEAFLRLTGYTREEVIGRSPRFLQGEGTQTDRLKMIRDALELGNPVHTELVNYKKDGEAFWIDLDIVPVYADGGKVTHFVAVQREITKRKLMEERLQASEIRHTAQRNALIALAQNFWSDAMDVVDIFRYVTELSSRTLEVALVSVWALRRDEGVIKCLNLYDAETEAHSSGVTLSVSDYPSYLKALYDREIIIADDALRDPVTRELSDSYLNPLGVTSLMDVPIRSGGGLKYVLCLEHRGPVRSWTSDEKTFALAVSNAISLALETRERVLAQKEIDRSHQRFQAVAAATNDTIWEWDLERRRFWWQDGLSRLFGWPEVENESSVHAWVRQIHFEDRHRVMAGICSAIRSGQSQWSDEYRFVNNDGSIAHIMDRARVFRDAQGKALKMVGGMMDVTEKISAARELMEAHQALRMLSACNQMLLRATDEEQLIREVCRIAVEVGEYRMAWVGYAMDDELKSVVPMAHAGVEDGYFSLREFSWAEDREAGQGPTGRAIRSGKMIVIEDMFVNPMFSPWAHLARERGYRCGICLPLHDDEHVFGVLVLYGSEPHLAGDEEVRMLKEMASALGFGIQSLRNRNKRQHLEQTVVKVAKAVSNVTGAVFFDELSRSLVDAVGAEGGLIGRFSPGDGFIETVSVIHHGKLMDGFRYSLAGAPFESFLCGKPCVVNHVGRQLFPDDSSLADLRIEAYGGVALCRQDGTVIGILMVFFQTPLKEIGLVESTLMIFATRAAAELDRQQAETRLLEQASLLDQARDAILVRDLNHVITYWNKGAEHLYGWTAQEAVGRSVRELMLRGSGIFDFAFAETMDKGGWIGEIEQADKYGNQLVVEGRWTLVRDGKGRAERILVINTDITERRRLEQQLSLAQRLDMMGTLAGGVAHDLKNILSPIVMAVELLKLQVFDRYAAELLNTIASSATRGVEMVSQILSFARGVDRGRSKVDVGKVIVELDRVLRDTLLRRMELKVEIAPDLRKIQGDSMEIHQVILNLCVNARDATFGSGVIFIRARNIDPNELREVSNAELKQGPYVCIEVEDNGEGIPPGMMDKIFEPFFTTKPFGKGSGLGLSSSMVIVRNHGGFIQVDSEPEKGTLFKVFLPALSESVDPALPFRESEQPHGQGKTVLIVDDEASIRQVLQQSLETFGYQCLVAVNGEEAVAIYREHQSEIDIVITDMIMPVMDGPTAIRILRQINPSVRIIATSGVSSNRELAIQAGVDGRDFLLKPYTAVALLECMDRLLADHA